MHVFGFVAPEVLAALMGLADVPVLGSLAPATLQELLEVGLGPLLLFHFIPGSERAPTLAEVQEIQRRLTALGFDTGGTDGRVGNDTMSAVQNFQRKIGMQPADGYAGVGLLARLREAR